MNTGDQFIASYFSQLRACEADRNLFFVRSLLLGILTIVLGIIGQVFDSDIARGLVAVFGEVTIVYVALYIWKVVRVRITKHVLTSARWPVLAAFLSLMIFATGCDMHKQLRATHQYFPGADVFKRGDNEFLVRTTNGAVYLVSYGISTNFTYATEIFPAR